MISQEVGGTDNGVYQIKMAMLEFDDIPSEAGSDPSPTTTTAIPSATSASTSKHALGLGILHTCAMYVLAMHVLLYTRVR